MDSTLIDAIAADFGLDLLQLHDEIRLGTVVAPPHCDANKVSDFEEVKNIYAEASKTADGRAELQANAKFMSDLIRREFLAHVPVRLCRRV